MTRKIFWDDPYLSTYETEVKTVEGAFITLKETIFFAFSGGQESDNGTIGAYPVLNARKVGRKIVYQLPEEHLLDAGDTVQIRIDWSRRYSLMRLHFAAELILELAYKKLKGTKKIGAHISADKARLDFEWNKNITPLLPDFQKAVAEIVKKDLHIVSCFSDEENERRFWEIENIAKVPCGGTHLKRTGEVGQVVLKRKNIGKGKERIEIILGS